MFSVYLTPSGVHLLNGSPQYRGRGLDQLHLCTHVALHIGAHQEIVLPPFLTGQTSFGLDDGVDASNYTHAANMEDRFRTLVLLRSKLKPSEKPNGDLPLLATSHAISKRTASSKSNSSSHSSRPERDVTDRLRASGMLGENKIHYAQTAAPQTLTTAAGEELSKVIWANKPSSTTSDKLVVRFINEPPVFQHFITH